MRSRLIAALVTATACAPVAADAATPREVGAMHRCDQAHVRACILRAALHRGQDPARMRAVAYCESRLNPLAVNYSSGASGLFQFIASTWAGTPYAAKSRFSAKWSALAAGWMWDRGRIAEWSCA